jgi:hypothetical protein
MTIKTLISHPKVSKLAPRRDDTDKIHLIHMKSVPGEKISPTSLIGLKALIILRMTIFQSFGLIKLSESIISN